MVTNPLAFSSFGTRIPSGAVLDQQENSVLYIYKLESIYIVSLLSLFIEEHGGARGLAQ